MLLSLAVTSHYKIFSADADVRLARRIRRDTVEKGRDIATVLDQVRTFHVVQFQTKVALIVDALVIHES